MSAVSRVDIVLAADFAATGDIGCRLAQEVRALAGRRSRVALLHTGADLAERTLAPEIRTCLRRGLAEWIIAEDGGAGARRMILHAPGSVVLRRLGLPWDGLEEVAVICHSARDATVGLGLPSAVRQVWHPVTDGLRRSMRRAMRPVGPTWFPVAEAFEPAAKARRMAVGWIGADPVTDAAGAEHVRLDNIPVSLDRIVTAISVLMVRQPADTLVAAMLASGRKVVAHPSLLPRYGVGLVYNRDLMAGLSLALDGGGATRDAAFLRACQSAPVLRLAPDARVVVAASEAQRPILFLSSNGVGIGHLTRLLAVARQVGAAVPVAFATQAQAVGIVESFGYPVDYLPSPGAVGGDFTLWDEWFAAHLERLLDRYDPAMLVYDGNHPSDGLIRAVAARRDCRLVWMRRGMWGESVSDTMRNARWCDLVIEPGELAASYDKGITAALRDEALCVNPIRLLTPADLLTREAATAEIGLDPLRPAVLVQLGSGYQRDLLALLDQMIGVLRGQPRLQICVAEWANGTLPLTLWPDVTVLRGFPLSQYIRAFDFCISAAGYNAFHEMIGFSVPTIFVANRQPGMDDQYARARFAQDNAAAFEISEHDLHDLPDLVRLMLQDRARRYLQDRCATLNQGNGAEQAARALLDMLGLARPAAMAAE